MPACAAEGGGVSVFECALLPFSLIVVKKIFTIIEVKKKTNTVPPPPPSSEAGIFYCTPPQFALRYILDQQLTAVYSQLEYTKELKYE